VEKNEGSLQISFATDLNSAKLTTKVEKGTRLSAEQLS